MEVMQIILGYGTSVCGITRPATKIKIISRGATMPNPDIGINMVVLASNYRVQCGVICGNNRLWEHRNFKSSSSRK